MSQFRHQIGLVINRQHWVIAGAYFLQHIQDNLAFLVHIRIRHIDDMQNEVRFDDFFQCGTKCRH